MFGLSLPLPCIVSNELVFLQCLHCQVVGGRYEPASEGRQDDRVRVAQPGFVPVGGGSGSVRAEQAGAAM